MPLPPASRSPIIDRVPAETIAWLAEPDNPAVAVLTRRTLLGEEESAELRELWARRNAYEPVAHILELMHEDGSWAPPARDYKKYEGSLWQMHFLGELYADGDDERVRRAAGYAFSRQVADGAFSCSGGPNAEIACLTANVGRALARLGYARDERVLRALAWIVSVHRRDVGLCDRVGCFSAKGYCHMAIPKILLFLGEVPRELWPEGAEDLRDYCVTKMREREIFRCLTVGTKEYEDGIRAVPSREWGAFRERWLAEHGPIEFAEKPGWLRLGYPLSYNSDVLEALLALQAVGEPMRPEYEAARTVVEAAADERMRWKLRTSFNGKMLADVERKGEPNKWVTWRGLRGLSR